MYCPRRYRNDALKSLEEEARERGLKPAMICSLGDDAIRDSIPFLPALGRHVPDGFVRESASDVYKFYDGGDVLAVRMFGPRGKGEISPTEFAYVVRRRQGYRHALVRRSDNVVYHVGVYRATGLREIARETRGLVESA